MTAPMLETKLHIPAPRDGLVARSRLHQKLDGARRRRVVLVSAPPGFGKTTLVADWLNRRRDTTAVAWLSLDRRDNDPAVFWPYLLAAVRRAVPDLEAVTAGLLAAGPALSESALTVLANGLGSVSSSITLVLDDYHLIESRPVQNGVASLVEDLPANVQLVVITRADPALPLARMRVRDDLLEIRAADLRFTVAEAAEYFAGAAELAIDAQHVAALEARTEGWIAALQLAALSLRGTDDVAGFIDSFAGDDRYVLDYLVEEVLQRQSEEVRSFLLRTCILNRLEGSLCDAVTGVGGGRARLAALDQANLFVVRLDDRSQWYRYHHLFADALLARLLDEDPDALPELHRRASQWFERHGEPAEAIHHALAGHDFGRAADLVELALPALRRDRQDETQRRWLGALPDVVVHNRPVLLMGQVGALMVGGQLDGVDRRLAQAERWIALPDAPDEPGIGRPAPVVVDEVAFRRLPAGIELYRAGAARLRGDHDATREHALRARELAERDDYVGRAGPAALLGLERWTAGDLVESQRLYDEAIAALEEGGHLSDALGCALALSDMQVAQGHLSAAARTLEHGRRLSADAPVPLRGVRDMHVALAELALDRGDDDTARRHLDASDALGDHLGLPQNPYRRRVAAARLREADGDLDAALELLAAAETVFDSDFSPEVRPVGAVRARMLAAHGRWPEAMQWVRSVGLATDDDPSYLREYGHVTLARVLLAQHANTGAEQPLAGATRLLDRILQAAEEGGRAGTVIECRVLLGRAHLARGDAVGALEASRRALLLGEPEGFVKVFTDEIATLRPVMERATDLPDVGGYARVILRSAAGSPAAAIGPAEPLSPRELEVLRMLGTELSGPEIARTLVVSLHTVRAHTKSIYSKLGVTSRRAAVRRGHELGLLPAGSAR